jgi:uncharacterized protein with HEPN domain
MPRDYKVYLDDILEATARIRAYTVGLSLEELRKDTKTLDAVVRNLEVIGEAAKKVPPEVRRRKPGVEWKKIAGLRDVLIHEYFGIDLDIIWDIVQNKIPLLEHHVQQLLSE